MSTGDVAANKVLVTRFIAEVFEATRPEAVDELVSAEFTSHSFPSPSGDGKADLKAATAGMAKTLSDIKFTVQRVVAEGDLVVAQLTAQATPIAEFMGIAPSGRGYEIDEIHIFRVAGGQITEHWHEFDSNKLISQLRADQLNPSPRSPSA